MKSGVSKNGKHYILFRAVPTMACNYRCDYCFVDSQTKSSKASMFDIHSPAEWIAAMQKFSNYDVEFYFSGGEPFLIDGTYQLINGWTRYDHVISGCRIDTNLSFAGKIINTCPTSKVKLNASWHTQYDSLDSILTKLKALNDCGMVAMTNFVASPYNLDVIKNKYNLTVDKLVDLFDKEGIFLNVAADFNLVPSPQKTDPDYKQMILKYTSLQDWQQLRCEKSASLCHANHHFFTLQPNGDISPCLTNQVCGNFFEGTINFPEKTVCSRNCPCIVTYSFRSDNDFSFQNHLQAYVERNKQHRKLTNAVAYNAAIKNPRVSVVLPTYNHGDLLPRAVQGILDQSFTDFELIIVNDGSTDGTAAYLAALTDPRIRVINQANAKLPTALNNGFKAARGELLTWISSDNYCAPDFLASLISALDSHPSATFAYSDFAHIDSAGRITNTISSPDLFFEKLLLLFPGMASFMYRRKIHDQLGFYDPSIEGAEDWDMWLRISEKSGMVHVPRVLYYYLKHNDSMTARMPADIQAASEKVFDSAVTKICPDPTQPVFDILIDMFNDLRFAWKKNDTQLARKLTPRYLALLRLTGAPAKWHSLVKSAIFTKPPAKQPQVHA